MKILLLGFSKKKRSYTVKRLVAELKKKDHTVNYLSWHAIVFMFTRKGTDIKRAKGTDLKYYDFIIPKAPFSRGKVRKGMYLSHLYRHYLLIIDYINQHHKHVLNEKTAKKIPFYDKLFQYYLMNKKGLPIVPSILYTGAQTPNLVYKKFKKPYIAKNIEGFGGKQVLLIHKIKEVKKFINKFGIGKLLVQKYLPVKYDYRVLIIGSKVVGAMKRTAKEGEFRSNVSMGGGVEKADISNEMKKIALKAAAVFNAEFTGVDIIKHKGKYYILEVNIFPGFEGFERATKINVAEKLASYIEKKYLWSLQTEFTKKEKREMFEDLYKIEKENLEKPLSKKGFLDTILKRDLIVIKKEEKPIAYLTHYREDGTRRITRYGISPKHRGQRMGRRILRALIRITESDNDETANAVIPAMNKKRQRTFKRIGFSKIEALKKYYPDGSDAFIFEYKTHPSKKIRGPGLTKTKKETKNKINKNKGGNK
ncbi:MAG: GNAT family N-acetyltransferase [Candidatus Spechtbacterales bacterium]